MNNDEYEIGLLRIACAVAGLLASAMLFSGNSLCALVLAVVAAMCGLATFGPEPEYQDEPEREVVNGRPD